MPGRVDMVRSGIGVTEGDKTGSSSVVTSRACRYDLIPRRGQSTAAYICRN